MTQLLSYGTSKARRIEVDSTPPSMFCTPRTPPSLWEIEWGAKWTWHMPSIVIDMSPAEELDTPDSLVRTGVLSSG